MKRYLTLFLLATCFLYAQAEEGIAAEKNFSTEEGIDSYFLSKASKHSFFTAEDTIKFDGQFEFTYKVPDAPVNVDNSQVISDLHNQIDDNPNNYFISLSPYPDYTLEPELALYTKLYDESVINKLSSGFETRYASIDMNKYFNVTIFNSLNRKAATLWTRLMTCSGDFGLALKEYLRPVNCKKELIAINNFRDVDLANFILNHSVRLNEVLEIKDYMRAPQILKKNYDFDNKGTFSREFTHIIDPVINKKWNNQMPVFFRHGYNVSNSPQYHPLFVQSLLELTMQVKLADKDYCRWRRKHLNFLMGSIADAIDNTCDFRAYSDYISKNFLEPTTVDSSQIKLQLVLDAFFWLNWVSVSTANAGSFGLWPSNSIAYLYHYANNAPIKSINWLFDVDYKRFKKKINNISVIILSRFDVHANYVDPYYYNSEGWLMAHRFERIFNPNWGDRPGQ